jgi:hypothetical protein
LRRLPPSPVAVGAATSEASLEYTLDRTGREAASAPARLAPVSVCARARTTRRPRPRDARRTLYAADVEWSGGADSAEVLLLVLIVD